MEEQLKKKNFMKIYSLRFVGIYFLYNPISLNCFSFIEVKEKDWRDSPTSAHRKGRKK